MDFAEKKACIEWFDEAINSKFGAVAESFLLTLQDGNEKHTLYSFAKSIENGRFSSIEDMVIHFKEEVDSIITFLGCSSNAAIYIQGYFKELIEKLEFDFLKQEKKKLDFDINEKMDFFEKIGKDLPNDLDSYLKMSSESSYPTMLELDPIQPMSNEIASTESVEQLNNQIKQVPTDQNLTHITEIIKFYQNTSNDRDDEENELFKFDLSKLSEHTLNKINEYIGEIKKNKSPEHKPTAPPP
ncbi:hypothetical protein M9Y10_022620 [Tritrichomonas musculus]|uniref:NET domain-containing protein n=1 Tax=Tritrichomonas musculus TaxID=1915356 RepID=A0ABR2KSR5_9EUKA